MKNTRSMTFLAIASSTALVAGCSSEQPVEYSDNTVIEQCVLQEEDGDLVVLDNDACEDGGESYATGHGGVYPWIFMSSGATTNNYAPGSTIPKSVALSSGGVAVKANADAAAKSAASSTAKAGANGTTTGSKGGFGGGTGGGGS